MVVFPMVVANLFFCPPTGYNHSSLESANGAMAHPMHLQYSLLSTATHSSPSIAFPIVFRFYFYAIHKTPCFLKLPTPIPNRQIGCPEIFGDQSCQKPYGLSKHPSSVVTEYCFECFKKTHKFFMGISGPATVHQRKKKPADTKPAG